MGDNNNKSIKSSKSRTNKINSVEESTHDTEEQVNNSFNIGDVTFITGAQNTGKTDFIEEVIYSMLIKGISGAYCNENNLRNLIFMHINATNLTGIKFNVKGFLSAERTVDQEIQYRIASKDLFSNEKYGKIYLMPSPYSEIDTVLCKFIIFDMVTTSESLPIEKIAKQYRIPVLIVAHNLIPCTYEIRKEGITLTTDCIHPKIESSTRYDELNKSVKEAFKKIY